VDLRCELYLNPLIAGLQTVRGSVVEGDPVGEDPVGVEPANQEQGLLGAGKPGRPLDFPDLGLETGPARDAGVEGQAGQQVLVVRQVRGIDGDRGHSGLEERGDLDLGPRYVLGPLDSVVVGVDGDRNRNSQLVADGVDLAGEVPVVDPAVGVGAALRLGDLDQDRGIRPLCGPQRPANRDVAPTAGGDGHRLPLGHLRPVDRLTADDQRLRVGEESGDVGRTPHGKRFVELRRHGHLSSRV
jgi:hypothetical protein